MSNTYIFAKCQVRFDQLMNLKDSPKGMAEICKVIEEMRKQEREEGRVEGHLSLLFKLLRNGTLTIEQAAANNETTIPVLLEQLRNAGYEVTLKENRVVFGAEG